MIINRPRDSQRQKVYTWEDRELIQLHSPRLDLGEVASLVEECLHLFAEYHQPRIQDGRGTRRPFAGAWRMNFPMHARTPVIVCHEAAHTYQFRLFGSSRVEVHGPEFMRIYLEMLAAVDGWPLSMLENSARRWGLRVAKRQRHLIPCAGFTFNNAAKR